MKLLKCFALILPFVFLLVKFASAQDQGGYATMRVFDCNKSVSLGSGFLAAKIIIIYEDGTMEDIPLQSYSEKNEIENLKKVNQVINKLKTKGYFLISQYTTGEQGNLISDYTFLKQK